MFVFEEPDTLTALHEISTISSPAWQHAVQKTAAQSRRIFSFHLFLLGAFTNIEVVLGGRHENRYAALKRAEHLKSAAQAAQPIPCVLTISD